MWPERMDFGCADGPRSARPLVERTPRIDVRDVRRIVTDEDDAIAMLPGRKRRPTFVAMRLGPKRIAVSVALRPGGASGAELVASPGRFGGDRWFAICPRCGRRSLSLYVRRDALACRACHGLVYASQRLDPHWRAFFVSERLVGRFHDPDGRRSYEDFGVVCLWDKPPRMRWSTFGRLWAKYDKAADRFRAWHDAR